MGKHSDSLLFFHLTVQCVLQGEGGGLCSTVIQGSQLSLCDMAFFHTWLQGSSMKKEEDHAERYFMVHV